MIKVFKASKMSYTPFDNFENGITTLDRTLS